ncbi:hypothetical protein [Azospirillum sp. TSO22-1]|uniref:hypothetical protein n=1 Tax=Azospirillum sp. TSO22-1 TaxID=716789 RepID=UPI000D605AF7|nr:hypothetical protein [Azospirillum sp. TSO22-1]PWC43905.1 hypothetical protein TSO221_18675 [Azospirillum sp. TSO22-1]
MADIIDMKDWLSKGVNGNAEGIPLLERLACTRLRMITDLEAMITHCEMVSEYCDSHIVADAVGKLIGYRDIILGSNPAAPEAARVYTGIALALEKVGNDVSQAIREQLDTVLFGSEPA